MFYIIILFSILLTSLFLKKLKKSEEIIMLYSWIVFFLISILRDESVGADTGVYNYYFKEISNLGFPVFSYMGLEKGYVFLNSLIGFINKDSRFLMFSIAFIILGGYFIFIKNNSRDKIFSIILFFCLGHFFMSLHIYRQSIAIILLLIGYRFVKERKLIHFLFINIMAIMFHKTAIIFFPIYFLYHNKIRFEVIMGLISIGLIFLVAGNNIISVLMLNHYQNYSDKVVVGQGYNLLIFNLSILIGAFIIKTISSSIVLNKLKLQKEYNLLIYVMLIILNIQILAINFSVITRINMYFSSLLIILIPNFLTVIQNKKTVLLMKVIIFCMYLLLLIINIIQDSNAVVPYILN